jgi:hypothetical protein
MAKASEVTSSPTPSSSHSKSISMDDVSSLKIKKELVSCDEFIANMKEHTKVYFETLMCQLADVRDTIKEKEEFERLAADDIGSLPIELKEEQNLRTSLEEKLLGLEESYNLNTFKLTKERDHALAMVKVLKKEKVEFDVGHNDLRGKFEKLEESYKAFKGKFYSLTKIYEQLQIQLTIEQSKVPSMQVIEVTSSSNPLCDHGNIIEENTRLKAGLAKGLASCIQGEKNLNDLLSNQRMNKGKEGLRFVVESSMKEVLGVVAESSKKKKKNKKKKKKKKSAAPPTLHVLFDICYTEEEWEELKGKNKVEETGVSKSKGPESPSPRMLVQRWWICHLSPTSSMGCGGSWSKTSRGRSLFDVPQRHVPHCVQRACSSTHKTLLAMVLLWIWQLWRLDDSFNVRLGGVGDWRQPLASASAENSRDSSEFFYPLGSYLQCF